MKKVLCLSLIASSILSMQLDTIKENQILSKICIAQSLERDRVSYADNKNKMYIEPFSVKVPKRLGELDLYHGKKGFYVRQDDKKYTIKKYFTDPMVRNMSKTELKTFLTAGYLCINQMNDGEFSLKAKGRIVGGGPIFGGWMYWLTKSVCYGGLAVTAGAAVVGTGGAIVGAVAGTAVAGGAGTIGALAVAGNAASGVMISTAIGSTTGAAIITTAGVGVATAGTGAVVGIGATSAAAVIASTTAGAIVTKAAVVSTGAVIASGVGAGGIVAGIEGLSIAVGCFFGMLPTP